ncbi:hypothetical protein BGX38DRAFT_1221600 [Terfezia claveryi]|nr:hypothetical protein BGX38DRAFT_1221600 [Terfezia claveryi]
MQKLMSSTVRTQYKTHPRQPIIEFPISINKGQQLKSNYMVILPSSSFCTITTRNPPGQSAESTPADEARTALIFLNSMSASGVIAKLFSLPLVKAVNAITIKA